MTVTKLSLFNSFIPEWLGVHMFYYWITFWNQWVILWVLYRNIITYDFVVWSLVSKLKYHPSLFLVRSLLIFPSVFRFSRSDIFWFVLQFSGQINSIGFYFGFSVWIKNNKQDKYPHFTRHLSGNINLRDNHYFKTTTFICINRLSINFSWLVVTVELVHP